MKKIGGMSMNVLLGIDFGTSKVAAVLVNIADGNLVGASSRSTEAYLPLESYKKEQDIKKIEAALYACIEELLSGRNVHVVSCGLTGQMHGILGLDDGGRPVTNFVTWQDGRGEYRDGSSGTLLEEIAERAGKRPIATGYGIVTLYDWLKKKIQRPARVCALPDYFGMCLAGETVPVIDYTFADSLGCFESASNRWDSEFLDSLGIDSRVLPRIVPTGTAFGEIREPRLLQLMKSSRIPICVALGDNQASFIGSVREFYTTLLINIGTASQISYAVRSLDEALDSDRIDGYDVVVRPFVENGFLVAGNALAGGAAYTVLNDFFMETGRELFGVEKFEELWERMGLLAEKTAAIAPTGSTGATTGGMTVYPFFGGKRSDPAARGTIEGLDFTNFTPGNLIRATLDGMIRVLYDMIDEETGS
jgi:sedoheptulokinase